MKAETDEIMALEQAYLAPTYKRAPIVFTRGEGVYLYDSEGRRYLDFLAGIAVNVLGHGDPRVLAVLREQAGVLVHVSNLFHSVPHVLLARDLCQASFADRVFFCNSGTEANEGAIKFARRWALARDGHGKHEIVAFSNGFHGRTMGALAVTHNPRYREPFEPLIGGVRWATFNDLDSARAVIGPSTAAVIIEPIQGEGGVLPANRDFLQGLRRLCVDAQALLIVDEVQCGLGRAGSLWAYEAYGVLPDLMTLAKPLGSGLPIGAILMTNAVAEALRPGDHGSTFAAGPLVTAVARVVFDTLRQPEFLAHVLAMGEVMGQGLQGLLRHAAVQEVRGRGLMWGVQLDPSLPAGDVVAEGYRHGIVIGSAGNNTIRIVPPLVVQQSHVQQGIEILDEILSAMPAVSSATAVPA